MVPLFLSCPVLPEPEPKNPSHSVIIKSSPLISNKKVWKENLAPLVSKARPSTRQKSVYFSWVCHLCVCILL